MAKTSSVALTAYKSGLKAKRAGRHRTKQFTIPVAAIGGFMPLLDWMAGSFSTGQKSPEGMVRHMARDLCMVTTGYDTWNNKWSMGPMWHGTFPIILGLLVHKVAGKLGVNRALGRAGVPFLRV